MNWGYIIDVIESCQTSEQLDSCKGWIFDLALKTGFQFEDLMLLLNLVLSQRIHLLECGERYWLSIDLDQTVCEVRLSNPALKT